MTSMQETLNKLIDTTQKLANVDTSEFFLDCVQQRLDKMAVASMEDYAIAARNIYNHYDMKNIKRIL